MKKIFNYKMWFWVLLVVSGVLFYTLGENVYTTNEIMRAQQVEINDLKEKNLAYAESEKEWEKLAEELTGLPKDLAQRIAADLEKCNLR